MGTKHQFQNLPLKPESICPELLENPKLKWVAWKAFDRDGKVAKIPVDPKTGKPTNANTRSIQMTAAEAIASGYDGVGIALGSGTGYTIIDWDDCIVDGVWDAEIKAVVDSLNSYTEVSPSGNGVKVWLRGEYTTGKWKNDSGRCEVYVREKPYMTVTGHGNGKPIADLDEEKMDAICERFLERAGGNATPEFTRVDEPDQDEARELALEKCRAIEPEIQNDGTGYVMKVMKVCVLCGCDFGTASGVLEDMIEEHELGLATDDEWLEKRYDDVFQRNKDQYGKLLVEEPDEYRTDLAVAKRVCRKAEGRIFFVEAWKSWACWDGRKFTCGTDRPLISTIEAVVEDLLSEMPDFSFLKAKEAEDAENRYRNWCLQYQGRKGIDAIIRLCRSLLSVSHRGFNQKTDLFHCDNVVLSLGDSVRAEAHDPENMNTLMSEVTYDASAKCPRWNQFVREVFIDENGKFNQDLCDYIQKLFGYFMTGRTNDQSVYIFYGGGGNGKGVLVNVLEKLLGDYGSPVNQEIFVGKAPLDAVADLYGRRCVFASETSEDCALKENQVKNLTGGESIQARRLYENLWRFKPTHKMLLATNHKPTIIGTDKGIWRRVKMVPFLASFDNDKEPGLQEKLYAELPGILNWAIEGYHLMLLEGLTPPEIVDRETVKYREEMNSIQQWINDRCQRDPDAEVLRSRLYKNYVDYCQEEGFKSPRSNRKFYGELSRQGCGEKKCSGRFITGLKLLTDFE